MSFLKHLFLPPLLVLAALSANAELIGRVVGVSDGDTLTVLDADKQQHKVRIAGIDSPEKAQAFGQQAKAQMSALVFGKEVRLEGHKLDRYGRTVAKVWVTPASCPTCPKTLDAGMAMVSVGLAWHYKQYQREQSLEDRERYAFAEFEARSRRAGLWSDSDPTPPWDWRKQLRAK